MAEDVIQLPPDSTGKKIRAIALVVGANTVYMEGCVPYDEDGIGLYAAEGEGRRALREELNVNAYISSPKVAHQGVDALWHGLENLEEVTPIKISKHWTYPIMYNRIGDETLICPVSLNEVRAISRNVYRYPHIIFKTRLPTFTVDGVGIKFGLKNTDSIGAGAFEFVFARVEGVSVLRAYTASQSETLHHDISFALPANCETHLNSYAIVVNKGFAEFYINRVLRGVAINSSYLAFTPISGPPYGITRSPAPIAPIMATVLEIEADAVAEVNFPINPMNINLFDGDPLPPRFYRLYETGTNDLLVDTTIVAAGAGAGEVDVEATSHPFPIFGFDGKTVWFMANQSGDLDVEVLMQTDNWRVPTNMSFEYPANELKEYPITPEAVLARIVFKPDAYPCTMSEGEVVLR